MQQASIVVVMGVSGSGKTTVAERLAERLRWHYAEADAFHPAANIAKMRAGIPLTDEDRRPWLDAIAAWIEGVRRAGRGGIVTCSALKRAYRERIAGGAGDLRFVYLRGSYELIASRLEARQHEYMPATLLRSQFDTLEEPAPEEKALVLSIERGPEALVDEIVEKLALRPS